MSFRARYPGVCANGDRIEPGDLVEYDGDDELRHTRCMPGMGYPYNETPCPSCNLVHKGECW